MGYRMIIADDEEMLICLIRKLGRFEELGIEIIDECRNGEDTLNSILENKPDFVLTDIQMPVLDGLEMIERVYRSNPDILFVLLSGYRYFEYAQSAVRLNVVDYLLKPVDAEQLNHVLERLCRLTDDRRRRETDSASFLQLKNIRSRERQNAFWQEILAADRPVNPALLHRETLQKEYEIALPGRNVQMLFLNADFSRAPAMARISFAENLNRIADSAFGGKAAYCQKDADGGFFVLLSFADCERQSVRNAISSFYYSCSEQWSKYLDMPITLGISSECADELPFSRLVREAKIAVWGRMVLSSSPTIRFPQLLEMERFNPAWVLTEDRIRQLQDSLRYLRQQELSELYAGMSRDLERYRRAFPGDAMAMFARLRECVCAVLPDDCREEIDSGCIHAARLGRDYRDALQKQYAVLEQYVTRQRKALEARNRKPAETAMDYARQNYARDVSLESAAGAAGLSPAYLSRVFKEATGMGFNEYVTELRMEESKRLLANTALSIHDVARAVGYLDEKYYSKLFKKQFGIKPTEYRKLYG